MDSRTILKKIIRKIFGIRPDVALNLNQLERTVSLKWEKKIYKKKYSTDEFIQVLKGLGMHEGSCVFIQSSWNSFFNYTGTPNELIDAILEVIGENGTLAMPAFPMNQNVPLNLKRSVTGAGMLAEAFRRHPNVKRSINIQHSVCAIGPQSDYLINEHHLSDTCFDEKSPYYKLCKVDALIFCLGMGYNWLSTSYHCVESINSKEVKYYADFFKKEKTPHEYIDYDGVKKLYYCYDLAVERGFKIIPERFFLSKYLDRGIDYQFKRISNLTISCYYAKSYLPKLISLGRKGIDIYRSPSKKGYTFEK